MSLQLCLKNYCMKRNGVSFLHFHASEQELISSQCYAHYRVNKYLMFLMINMIKIISPGILSSNIYSIIIYYSAHCKYLLSIIYNIVIILWEKEKGERYNKINLRTY